MKTSKNLFKSPPRRAQRLSVQTFWGWLFFAVYSLLVIRGAAAPASEFPRWSSELNDKWVHASEFFLLYLSAWGAFSSVKGRLSAVAGSAAFLYCAFMGAFTEILQIWAPTRSAESADFFADAAGFTAAWLLTRSWRGAK